MDKRTKLILTRAKELLSEDDPGGLWIDVPDQLDVQIVERQSLYLSQAEHQLLDEELIACVDQS